MDPKIDFVLAWVDGSDKAWQAEKKKYTPRQTDDDGEERFRDWENLRYWFRGVERFAPWVRRIHFVTYGHLPDWLDTSNPKLHIVKHGDYMPKEFLPCFSSHPIELNLHRIRGLSEHFVYFNDDFFCIRPVKPEDFFRNGKPYDMLAFQPVIANPVNPVMSRIYINNSLVLSKYFTKRKEVLRRPWNYFRLGYPPMYFIYNLLELAFPQYTGFFTPHGPSPFLKETFRELWSKEQELLWETSTHKFRGNEDVSQYLFREWQKLRGNFVPGNVLKDFRYFTVESNNPGLVSVLRGQKAKIICINDSSEEIDFERAKRQINGAFANILPEKSAFEK